MAITGRTRLLGSILILSGTAIGAGMLALPLIAADIGFWAMAGLMFAVFLFVVLAALFMLEANLAIEPGCSLYIMARRTLGTPGRVFGNHLTSLAILLLYWPLICPEVALWFISLWVRALTSSMAVSSALFSLR